MYEPQKRPVHRLSHHREIEMGVLAGYIRERDLARELGLTVWALRAWRKRGYGPAASKIGRLVVYRANEVADFIDDQAEGRA